MRDHAKGGALTEVTFFILLSLIEPRHGYGIMQFIEKETKGRLTLGAGTLYGALNTMLEKGWIRLADNELGRKKYYVLTEAGHEMMINEQDRLKEVIKTASRILGDDDNE